MATLQGKTALVTGAPRGIGRATASALADAGAHVLAHYGRSAQDAESLVAGIRSKGRRADAIRADLGTPDGATLLAEEVRSIVGQRLDVLVLNAGISKAATIKDHTVGDFDNLFATNVRGPFFLVQQLELLHQEERTAHIGGKEIVKIPYRMVLDGCSLGDTSVQHEHIQSLTDDGANFLCQQGCPVWSPKVGADRIRPSTL